MGGIMIELKSIQNFLKRTIITTLLFFFFCLLIDNNIISKKLIYDSMIDFSYIRSKTNILLGNIFNKREVFVSSEKIRYKNIEKFHNSYKLEVDYSYVLKSIENGVVVFIGNKENLGPTIIVNCDDGSNIWYSNLENINVNLYDYIPASTILGSSKDNNIYLTFVKNDEYQSYEEYL